MVQPFEEKWQIPDGGLVIYDWKEKSGQKLTKDGIDVSIEGFGHKLFLLCPIVDGWAVVGLEDKLLAPSTIEAIKIDKHSVEIDLHEPGNIVLFSSNGTPESAQMEFKPMGNNFYQGATQMTHVIIQLNEK